jgi:hypothetical protein
VNESPATRRLLALVAALLACATCNYGEVTVVQPAAAGHGPLTLSIQVDPEDSAIARELGWSGGIPGADVTITAGGGDTAVGPPIATLVTDSAGKVSVPDLPDGKYFVAVRRLLTAAETVRLPPGEDVVGFMTQTVVDRGRTIVSVPASHRRSIVISEWSFFGEGIPGVGGYDYGGYLELENNSDTTVYLDGLVIGSAYTQATEIAPPQTCAAKEIYTDDPDGIWTWQLDTLPGTGHTYPLAPGAVSVIATDAIDHRGASPVEGLDLSHADFESIGTADPDNPAVPNTVSFLYPWEFKHGLYLNDILYEVAFVALPVDTTALPKAVSGFGSELMRVPRANILDVMSIVFPRDTVYSFQYGGGTWCAHLVHPEFERRPAPLLETHIGTEPDLGRWSVQRKVAYTRANGRKILQHTRTTDADFFLGLRTPFQLP